MRNREYKYIPEKWDEEQFYRPTLWMSRIIGRAGLSAAHRDIFAVIYGYTTGQYGEYTGSWAHLSALTMTGRTKVHDVLRDLEKIGLIQKDFRPIMGSNQQFPAYRADLDAVNALREETRRLDRQDEAAAAADSKQRLDASRHRKRN